MAKVFTITEGLENMGALRTGGQGSVYKARRTGELITAVKLLPTPIHAESADDKHFRDFQNEVDKLRKVNEVPNPNVVKILSSGLTESGSFPFIEMEFIEGPDLEELLKAPRDPIFTLKEAIKVADQLSHALAHCHKVNVKHGDIKSNNVKFNVHTGNYVLLDFGLAVMSDEQRRTSLRQAGAIEFMAPEQSEGRMLFQTDVYSFGIILYELLAGQVPFPLGERGEMARNSIMLAHLETPPPDLLQLRRQHLPDSWSPEKKEREMRVPDWLLQTVYRCLEKGPEARFASGPELHEFIITQSTLHPSASAGLGATSLLQQEVDRLRREKEGLQQQLQEYRQSSLDQETELSDLRRLLATREREWMQQAQSSRQHTAAYTPPPAPRKRSAFRSIGLPLLLLALIAVLVYVFWINGRGDDGTPNSERKEESRPAARTVIGQYKVVSPRAYFHNEPDPSTRRGAWMVPSNDVVEALEERNGYIYTEFTNPRGVTSTGWLRREDLITLDEWNRRQAEQPQEPERLSKIEINDRLQEARGYMETENYAAALPIYSDLALREVPEAMFEYANMSLQNRHTEITCPQAVQLVERSANAGYTPAKRTLGFLLIIGNNRDVLRLRDYDRCPQERDFLRGSRLLMEAVTEGDSTARRLLEELNIGQQE